MVFAMFEENRRFGISQTMSFQKTLFKTKKIQKVGVRAWQ